MLKTKVHGIAGSIACLIIATFWTSTVLVELTGSAESVALVKRCIIWGMGILIPSLILTGVSGRILGRSSEGNLVTKKKKRMPIIAFNGLFVLLPSAIFLDRWASSGQFDSAFYTLQAIELLAGAMNLFLIGSNIRDGLRLTGKLAVFPVSRISAIVFMISMLSVTSGKAESIFQENDHCVAYRTEKEMFFMANVEVIGKNCQVDFKSQWSDQKDQVTFEVTVPIHSFDSDNSKRDTEVSEILNADKYPHLRFTSASLSVDELKTIGETGKGEVAGILEFAGSSFPIKFPLTISTTANISLIEGKLVTSFSTFKISPPRVGIGGMIADTKDYLEILLHLRLDRLGNLQEIIKSGIQ
ncbi:MAG: YceI family protein [SAR324 cluster bacterium]|nr:YceI family protein [SAR324 cluster bacterium]